jgi:YD repeat-containing protein
LGTPALWLAGAALARADTYQYDELGRLVRVTFPDGKFVVYRYDAAGNRTEVIHSDNTTFTATLQVTGTGPANLRSIANAAGYGGAQHVNVAFQVGSAVTLMGAAGSPNGGTCIDTGTWPSDIFTVTLALQVSGKVYGGGGAGAMGGGAFNAAPGWTGGDAVYCRESISVAVNAGGQIKSGGGGGGSGGCWVRTIIDSEGQPETIYYGAGGGGGGFPNGAGGAGNATGANGTTSGGGAGGVGGDSTGSGPGGATRINGSGGAGGAAGAAGATGGAPSGSGGTGTWVAGNPGAGGQPGYAIRKNGKTVSVTNNGAITGAVG